jgi:DNA-binding response OmpR family regulator
MATILVAEDERDIRELIRFTLRHHGYEVISAADGEQAVSLARQAKPDLILLDVHMPRLTGYEVCRTLKADPLLRAIPIAFLSAKGQEAEIQEGLDLGAVEYILKPFAPSALVAQVRTMLGTAA